MSKSISFKTAILNLILKNLDITNIGDALGLLGSTIEGTLFVRLHTDASVVDNTNLGVETTYTGYVAGGLEINRNASDWTVVGDTATNAIAFTFPACTGGYQNLRYFSVWKNNISVVEPDRLYWGQLTADLLLTNNTVQFGIGALIIKDK